MSGGATSEGNGITEGDRERIREFVETPPDKRVPSILVPDKAPNGNGRSVGVTAQTCVTIRRTMAEAETVREVMEGYPDTHTSEIMKHAYGECSHNHEVPATASPQIKPRECRLFRERYAAGYSVAEIASEFYRADNTITRHIFGRCSHPNDPRPATVSEVRPADCDRLRATYRGNDKVTVNAASTAMGIRPEVSAVHLFGYCSCSGSVEPAREGETW